jgi:hypothetical protein
MTVEDDSLPEDGQSAGQEPPEEEGPPAEQGPLAEQAPAKVDLAVQVAHIAAQVAAAMRSGSQEKRGELETKLTLARERLEERGAPEGLIPFIDVVRGLLGGQDVAPLVAELPPSYRAVYAQIMDDLEAREEEGELTVREVLDQVSHNVVLAMKRGTFEHRRRMANTMWVMEQEATKRPDLAPLIDFMRAARTLLKGGDPSPVVERLGGPFLAKWEEMLDEIRE